jgi:hypothetical protein
MNSYNANSELAQLKEEIEKLKTINATLEKELELKSKEDDIKTEGSFAKSAEDPDHYLLCRKQRNYEGSVEGEPTIKLWFHRDAQQYIGQPKDRPMWFVNYPHVAT